MFASKADDGRGKLSIMSNWEMDRISTERLNNIEDIEGCVHSLFINFSYTEKCCKYEDFPCNYRG